jgi:site-specific DNA recombinase
MTQAAIYCRISKDREGAGLGVERQRSDCEALAARLGWTVVQTFTDNDMSAYSGKPRPEYRKLCEAIEAGTVEAVLAWHPDRLHRSPRELEGFIDLVERHGTAVQTVTAGTWDITTPSGRLSARTLGNFARYESEHKAERLQRKAIETAKEGKPGGGGTRPFGYESDRVTVREDEAALIRDAAHRILAGESVRGIVGGWRRSGVVSGAGKPWQPTPLRRMLTSARLAGLREHGIREAQRNGTRPAAYAGTWPAIISAAEHERLRAILLDPTRRTTPGNARVNLLAGFMICGRCSARLVGRPRPDHVRRYLCPSKEMGGCNGLAIQAVPTEAVITAAVLHRLASSDFADAICAEDTPEGAEDAGALQEYDARLAQLADEYATGGLERGEWDAARSAIKTQRDALRARLGRSNRTDTLADVTGPDAAKAWEAMSFDRRRAVLATLIERVTVAPGRRGYNRFDPERLSVKWRL